MFGYVYFCDLMSQPLGFNRGAVWLEWMQMGRRERFNIRSKSLSQAQQTIWAAEQSYRPQWTKRQVGHGEWGEEKCWVRQGGFSDEGVGIFCVSHKITIHMRLESRLGGWADGKWWKDGE